MKKFLTICTKCFNFMKNILSFPFNSKLVFKIFENLLKGSPGGYILSFHDLSPEVFMSQVECLQPSKPISLNELISRYKSIVASVANIL